MLVKVSFSTKQVVKHSNKNELHMLMLRKESFNKKQVDKYSSKNQTAVANSSE
jgi:hypothetical protein